MMIFRSVLGCTLALMWYGVAAEDLAVGDFNRDDFGAWSVTGEAFGRGPAQGTLPEQMEVSGYEGGGYLSSFRGGDDATGKAVSPWFEIQRSHLNFLVGGGGFEGETCINLVSEKGEVLRTATGPNLRSGGSERLTWETWDVAELDGAKVRVEVLDQRRGGWGHISVDEIHQSDRARILEVEKVLVVDKRYLLWPVVNDESLRQKFVFRSDEELMTYANIALSERPDQWVFTDLANLRGKTLRITGRIPAALEEAWKKVGLSDTYPGEGEVYEEVRRPQYHFTSRRGWINDPNGLVHADGRWHLCYQHNPYNVFWDNMTWGHAVSRDLLHWEERPPALWPGPDGVMFSGSGFVVPRGRTALPLTGPTGLGFAYTAWGEESIVPGKKATQAMAYSNDGGRTFTKFQDNPVVGHIDAGNRDPKVFWHEPTKRWVMALYHDRDEYGIHVSPDLVEWEQTSTYRIPGDSECPDLFELAVDGEEGDVRWVAWGANGVYVLGAFDGRTFEPAGEPQRHYWGNVYAGQSYDNAPDGRRVHFGWMRGDIAMFEGAPFSMQMSLPMDFRLRSFDGKARLWIEPSPELEELRTESKVQGPFTYSAGAEDPLTEVQGRMFEIEATIDVGGTTAEKFGLRLFGEPFVWTAATRTFSGAEGAQVVDGGKVRIRAFSDVGSVEVFVNGTYIARYLRQKGPAAGLVAEGGGVSFEELNIHTLGSVWK